MENTGVDVYAFLDAKRAEILASVNTLVSNPNAQSVDINTNFSCMITIRKHTARRHTHGLTVEVINNTTGKLDRRGVFDYDSNSGNCDDLADWCILIAIENLTATMRHGGAV